MYWRKSLNSDWFFCSLSLKVRNFSLKLSLRTVVENPACSYSLSPIWQVFSDSCLRKTSFPSTVSTTAFLESVRSISSERLCANNALPARISCKQEQEVLIFTCSYPRQSAKSGKLEKRCCFSFRASCFRNWTGPRCFVCLLFFELGFSNHHVKSEYGTVLSCISLLGQMQTAVSSASLTPGDLSPLDVFQRRDRKSNHWASGLF